MAPSRRASGGRPQLLRHVPRHVPHEDPGADEPKHTHHAAGDVAHIQAELSTVLEFLALSLAAGEGLLDALRRVARVGSGELAGELGRVVADVGTGIPVTRAFDDLARRLAMPPVSRLVDQLAGSLERGTPLAEVLRAQAQDAREVAKRELLESAGRKEVGMLVPRKPAKRYYDYRTYYLCESVEFR
jgi:hypothetical protein